MKHARASSSGLRLGSLEPRLDVRLSVNQELGRRPRARHPRRVEVDVQPADQVDDMLGQSGVAAGDAAVGEAVGGLAEEPGRQPGKPRVAGDRDRGQARDLAGVLAQRRLRHPQDEQVERRVGAEDRRLGGVVAGDVARIQRGGPVLLGAVQPAPEQQRDVQAFRIAGGDVPRASAASCSAPRRSGTRRSTRDGRPTSAPRTGRSSRCRCATGDKRRRTTSPRSRPGPMPAPHWCRSSTSSCARTAPWLVQRPVSPSTLWAAGRHSTTARGPFR